MVDAPKYEAPPPDPATVALGERAKSDQLAALQNTARMDTATLMARYGTMLATAGTGITPVSSTPLLGGPIFGR